MADKGQSRGAKEEALKNISPESERVWLGMVPEFLRGVPPPYKNDLPFSRKLPSPEKGKQEKGGSPPR